MRRHFYSFAQKNVSHFHSVLLSWQLRVSYPTIYLKTCFQSFLKKSATYFCQSSIGVTYKMYWKKWLPTNKDTVRHETNCKQTYLRSFFRMKCSRRKSNICFVHKKIHNFRKWIATPAKCPLWTKEIQIIHRLFLVIAMYCQASSMNH